MANVKPTVGFTWNIAIPYGPVEIAPPFFGTRFSDGSEPTTRAIQLSKLLPTHPPTLPVPRETKALALTEIVPCHSHVTTPRNSQNWTPYSHYLPRRGVRTKNRGLPLSGRHTANTGRKPSFRFQEKIILPLNYGGTTDQTQIAPPSEVHALDATTGLAPVANHTTETTHPPPLDTNTALGVPRETPTRYKSRRYPP